MDAKQAIADFKEYARAMRAARASGDRHAMIRIASAFITKYDEVAEEQLQKLLEAEGLIEAGDGGACWIPTEKAYA